MNSNKSISAITQIRDSFERDMRNRVNRVEFPQSRIEDHVFVRLSVIPDYLRDPEREAVGSGHLPEERTKSYFSANIPISLGYFNSHRSRLTSTISQSSLVLWRAFPVPGILFKDKSTPKLTMKLDQQWGAEPRRQNTNIQGYINRGQVTKQENFAELSMSCNCFAVALKN